MISTKNFQYGSSLYPNNSPPLPKATEGDSNVVRSAEHNALIQTSCKVSE